MTLAQEIGRINASIEVSTKAREFCTLARIVAMSRGDHALAVDTAEKTRLSPTIRSILSGRPAVYAIEPTVAARQKAAISAGTTSDSGWARPLSEYQVLAGAFQIDERKAVAILVVSDELAKFGDVAAGNLFSVELTNGVAVETDSQFVAVLISGATLIGSSGVTAEHVRSDLRAMLATVTTNARGALFLLVTSAIAKTLAVLHDNTGGSAFPTMGVNGGTIAGIQVVVSDGVPASTMLLVDAQQLAAASETIQLSAISEATVQLETAPDSPASGGSVMTSLWQANLAGLKAERVFGVEKLTNTGVAALTGVAYTGDSPGP